MSASKSFSASEFTEATVAKTTPIQSGTPRRWLSPVAQARLARLARLATPWAVPAALLALWQMVSAFHLAPETLLPSPLTVAQTAVDLVKDGTLTANLAISVQRVAIGYAVGASLGLVLGLALGLLPVLEELVGPTLDGIQQVPLYAWMPLIILALGIGEVSKLAFIAVGAFYPMLLNARQGVKSVDPKHLEVAAVYGYGRWATLWRVVLPGAVPLLLAGARISLGVAWMMVVGAELFGADSGVGFMITYARNLFESDIVLLGVGVVGVIGFVMDWGLQKVEGRLLAWRTVHAED